MGINKNRIGRLKVYLERGKGHFGTIQMISTVLILLGVFKDTQIGVFIFAHSLVIIPLLVVCFYALLIFVGRLDYKYRIMDEENKIQAQYNPVLSEILDRVKKIEEKI
jgi:hypothetical protein